MFLAVVFLFVFVAVVFVLRGVRELSPVLALSYGYTSVAPQGGFVVVVLRLWNAGGGVVRGSRVLVEAPAGWRTHVDLPVIDSIRPADCVMVHVLALVPSNASVGEYGMVVRVVPENANGSVVCLNVSVLPLSFQRRYLERMGVFMAVPEGWRLKEVGDVLRGRVTVASSLGELPVIYELEWEPWSTSPHGSLESYAEAKVGLLSASAGFSFEKSLYAAADVYGSKALGYRVWSVAGNLSGYMYVWTCKVSDRVLTMTILARTDLNPYLSLQIEPLLDVLLDVRTHGELELADTRLLIPLQWDPSLERNTVVSRGDGTVDITFLDPKRVLLQAFHIEVDEVGGSVESSFNRYFNESLDSFRRSGLELLGISSSTDVVERGGKVIYYRVAILRNRKGYVYYYVFAAWSFRGRLYEAQLAALEETQSLKSLIYMLTMIAASQR